MRNRLFRLMLALLAIAVAYGTAVPAQRKLHTLRASGTEDELRYLPSERLLTQFTAGMSTVVADFLWIQCLQYTGRHYQGDRDFTWLSHMLNMVTRLDPYFVPAYRYGAVFLSMLKADDAASLELLHKGMKQNPFAWELPYEAAMNWLINRPDHPQAEIQAAQYLAMAVATGNAPPFVAETAAALQARHDLTDAERAMWESAKNTGNTLMREMAAKKLLELDIRDVCTELSRIVADYAAKNGAPPKSLEPLITPDMRKRIPVDPAGGTYFINEEGRVQNTTILNEKMKRAINMMKGAVAAYKSKNGKLPGSLEELVEKKFLEKLPDHPYPWRRWHYRIDNGAVS